MKKVYLFFLFVVLVIFVIVIFFNFISKKKTNIFDYDISIIHNGIERRYKIHLPISYDKNKKTPVVLNFHGSGGDADTMAPMTNMNQTSDKYGFIVVYPEATGKKVLGKVLGAWNVGVSEKLPTADDVGYVSGVIDDLKNKFNIDESRIYATGISNGAQMTYKLACELSDKIAAIAPVASQGTFENCSMSRPVPTIHFHGTEDKCALYEGGVCGGCIQKYLENIFNKDIEPVQYSCESAPSFIEKWVKINKIVGEPKTILKKGSTKCISYGDDQESEVVFCSIGGMGHVWPGGNYGSVCDDYDSAKCQEYIGVVGKLNNDIYANEMMWKFFYKFSIKK